MNYFFNKIILSFLLMSALAGSNTGTSFNYACPAGQYVTAFNGNSGSYIDSVGITCSGGGVSPVYGGSGGGPYSLQSPNGFLGWGPINSGAGPAVDQISFQMPSGQMSTAPGTRAGQSTMAAGQCPSGQLITGISGAYGQFLNGLQIACGTASAPAVAPTTAAPAATAAAASSSSMWIWLFVFIVFIALLAGVYYYYTMPEESAQPGAPGTEAPANP